MRLEDKYTTKKDFWGNETVCDENGNEIGKVEKNWLGETVVKDSSGNRIGNFSMDNLGRKTFEEDHYSIFTGRSRKTRVDSSEPEQWEFNNAGEWDGDN